MVDLARQFGEAMGNRKALRDALGTRADPRLLDTLTEPHERGAILVAAVFDAFFSVYINRTRDLIRIAYPDGRAIVPNFLDADLANRLAEEAAKSAMAIQNMCLRALDYCPPVDITFGDYLRALVTSERDLDAEDSMGYRAAVVNAFRARGIRPSGVISYSDDALSWDQYEGPSDVRLDFREFDAAKNDPGKLRKMFARTWLQVNAHLSQFRLANDLPVQSKSVTPRLLIRPDRLPESRVFAEFVQRAPDTFIDPDEPAAGTFTFRGGTTVLVNDIGEVQYMISKPMSGTEGDRRREAQRAFLKRTAESFSLAAHIAYDHEKENAFRGIHRGF
jgi:hypothetical protein